MTNIGLQVELPDLLELLGAQACGHRHPGCDLAHSCGDLTRPHRVQGYPLAVASSRCPHDDPSDFIAGAHHLVLVLFAFDLLQPHLLAIDLHFDLHPDLVHHLHAVLLLQPHHGHPGVRPPQFSFPAEDHLLAAEDHHLSGPPSALLPEEAAPGYGARALTNYLNTEPFTVSWSAFLS